MPHILALPKIGTGMDEIILRRAKVITLNPVHPRTGAVLISGGRIAWVGNEAALPRRGRVREIDCRGQTVTPGFIDAHSHLLAYAESMLIVDLSPSGGITSISDIQRTIQKTARKKPVGAWIRAGGYDEFRLRERRHLTRWDLDEATADHPAKITHRSRHAHVLNSLALKLTGITRETPDPPGGLIERDIESGEPNGLCYEMSDFLTKRIPPLEEAQMESGLRTANQKILSFGITSVQEMSSHNDSKRWRLFERLKEEGVIKSRLSMFLGLNAFKNHRWRDCRTHLDPDQLRLGGVKIILDKTTGRLVPGQEELNEAVLNVHRAGFQVAIHAIEESATEAACSAIKYAQEKYPRPDQRHRIEHCSVCPPALAGELASLGVIVITQPGFIYYHGERYLHTVPRDQLAHLYPIKRLIKKGVKVAAGSDCPVAPANPLIGIYAAVTRKANTGRIVLAEERIPPLKALSMFTTRAAEASFEDAFKGSIAPGKAADLVVLNGDPTILPPEEIKDLEVQMTIINGEVVWHRSG